MASFELASTVTSGESNLDSLSSIKVYSSILTDERPTRLEERAPKFRIQHYFLDDPDESHPKAMPIGRLAHERASDNLTCIGLRIGWNTSL
jgi:hypothetical protein